MSKMEINQLIVVTDGKSNIGGNPATVAAEAAKRSIVVNAIGIIGNDGEDDGALSEIEDIARAGKGIAQYSTVSNLGYTMHGVTQKTINKTIETIVGKQLKEMIGGDISDLPPRSRGKIIEYMERLGEETGIKCCVVMDCSGSMFNRMGTARQSVIDLFHSLKARNGKSEIAVIAFPGEQGEPCKIISNFTENIDLIKSRVLEMKAGGSTPTAAAMNRALQLMAGEVDTDEVINISEPLLKKSIV
ncbi:MAG: vWA domain-containing protein [Bacillota bacterium]